MYLYMYVWLCRYPNGWDYNPEKSIISSGYAFLPTPQNKKNFEHSKILGSTQTI